MSFHSLITYSQSLLQTFVNGDGFTLYFLSPAFGHQFEPLKLQDLAQQFSLGDFSALPTVTIKSQSDLGGARGVYVSELNQIFLAREFVDNGSDEQIVAVILEEYGHSIDRLINTSDSKGDEGFIFSALVRGETLSDEELALAKAENDTVEVIIDGQIYQAEANIIEVTNTNNGGAGSLRQALADAVDGGTITFANSIRNGIITLTSGELEVNKSVTIDGGNNNITVSGNNTTRVFNINDGTTAVLRVNISDLTITGGSTSANGGGIYNQENLTLRDSTISSNSAKYGGGILNRNSTVSITNSTLSSNSAEEAAGGILNRNSTVSITNSTLSSNSAEEAAGGIFNYRSTTNITNSTISANSASNSGGGIFNLEGTVSITNSTISSNSAEYGGGGIFNIDSTASITSSTIYSNYAERRWWGNFQL